MTQQRKQSHDEEKSRPRRIDTDAGCDLRTCICARGRIAHAALDRSGRPIGPTSGTRLQCFLSGEGDAGGRAQCAQLPWRTEIERLTFFGSAGRSALASRALAPIGRHMNSPQIRTRIGESRRPGELDRLEKGWSGAYIAGMEKYRSRMLEVSVMLDRPQRWEWQVTSNGEMIANGFEDGQVEAKFEGYNAMFLLLAAGWNP